MNFLCPLVTTIILNLILSIRFERVWNFLCFNNDVVVENISNLVKIYKICQNSLFEANQDQGCRYCQWLDISKL